MYIHIFIYICMSQYILLVSTANQEPRNLAVEKSGQAWDDISVSCALKRRGAPGILCGRAKALFRGHIGL